MPDDATGAEDKAPAKRARGRPKKDPTVILLELKEHIAKAERYGTREYPLDNKSVAKKLKFSHTYISENGVEETPPETRGGWRKIRKALMDARAALEGGGLKAEVRKLRSRVRELEEERDRLWAWMVLIETAAMNTSINTEMLIPDDLKYARAERRNS